jgi:YYY domain-containing protein
MLALRARLVRRDDGSGTLLTYGLGGLGLIVLVGLVLGYALAGLLLALLIVVLWRLLARPRSPESALVLLLFATGLALSAAVEVVALDGDIGRMNTVFKFYLQVWVMWSLASAVALVGLRDRVIALVRPAAGRWWAVALALLVAGCAIYPVVSTRGKVAERFDRSIPPTLDGAAYMATAVYREDHPQAVRKLDLRFANDQRAIEWIWDNVDGSPVIAEASVPLYRWGSRISIYTGLPTILGWDWHQTQQRWGFRYMIEDRMRDLRALYSDVNRDRTLQLLSRYDVTYVYVGDLERAFYPEEGLRKFDEMVGRDLDLVYDQDGVKIYRVRGK